MHVPDVWVSSAPLNDSVQAADGRNPYVDVTIRAANCNALRGERDDPLLRDDEPLVVGLVFLGGGDRQRRHTHLTCCPAATLPAARFAAPSAIPSAVQTYLFFNFTSARNDRMRHRSIEKSGSSDRGAPCPGRCQKPCAPSSARRQHTECTRAASWPSASC